MVRVKCPVCGPQAWARVAATSEELTVEKRIRDEWVYARVRHNARGPELKDLVDFMHGDGARLLACAQCGTVLRQAEVAKGADEYEADPNDSGVMQQVYPRYHRAFAKKEKGYRELLRPRADVVEVGSHLGAFLQVAEEWDWRPVGLDIGVDTVPFARSRGLIVRQGTAEDAKIKSKSADAVYIWNCFEQLEEPQGTLTAARQWLKRHGLLVVRVPNAGYYFAHRDQPEEQGLAYNNLLAFPYLFGYNPESLRKLLSRSGFELVRAFNSELITSPFPDLDEDLRSEQCDVSRNVAVEATEESRRRKSLTGPWIEMVFRKTEDERGKRSSICSALDYRFLQRAA